MNNKRPSTARLHLRERDKTRRVGSQVELAPAQWSSNSQVDAHAAGFSTCYIPLEYVPDAIDFPNTCYMRVGGHLKLLLNPNVAFRR